MKWFLAYKCRSAEPSLSLDASPSRRRKLNPAANKNVKSKIFI